MMNRVLVGLLCIGLGGCATARLEKAIDKVGVGHTAEAEKASQEFVARIKAPKLDEIDSPYLTGRSVPLAKDEVLPEPFRKGVKLDMLFRSGSNVSLSSAGERITLATGIPVRIQQDVYFTGDMLLPKVGTGSGAAPPTPVSASGAAQADTVKVKMPTEEIELVRLLNLLAAQASVRWRYDAEENTIIFYRLVTVIKQINRSWSSISNTASLGTSTSSTRGGSGGTNFANDARTDVQNIQGNIYNSIAIAADRMTTRSGSVIQVRETTSLIVSDVPEVVERIVSFIDGENRKLTMRASLRVRIVRTIIGDQGDTSMDLNAIYSRIRQFAPGLRITGTAPSSVSTATSGGFQFTVLDPTDPSKTPGPFSGSDAFVQAIATNTKSFTVTDIMEVVPNRSSVASTQANKFSYVSEATPGTGAVAVGGASGAPGLKTSQEAVGVVSNLGLVIGDDNSMEVNISFSDSILTGLVRESTGGPGSSGAFVQNPAISLFGVLRPAFIKSGETAVVSITKRNINTSTARRQGDKWMPVLAGGSDTAKVQQEITYVLVEGVIEG